MAEASVSSVFGNSPDDLPGRVTPAVPAPEEVPPSTPPRTEAAPAPPSGGATLPSSASAGQAEGAGPNDLNSFLQSLAAEEQAPAPDPQTVLQQGRQVFDQFILNTRKNFTTPGPGGSEFELIQVAKQSGMFERVWQDKDSGTVMVQRPGQAPETFERELINARTLFEMAAEGGGRVLGAVGGFGLGGAGGSVIPGPGTAAGAISVAALGQATVGGLTAMLAKNVGDVFAEHVLQIPRDPARTPGVLLKETAFTGLFASTLSGIGSKIMQRSAAKQAQKQALHGGTKSLTDDAIQAAEDAADSIEVAKGSGIKLDSDTRKFILDPQQQAGAVGVIPEADVAATTLNEQGAAFREWRAWQGKQIKGAFDGLISRFQTMVPGERAAIAADFNLTADGIRKMEGKIISDFRGLVSSRVSKAPQAVSRTREQLDGFRNILIDDNGKTLKAGDAIERIMAEKGVSKDDARVIYGYVKRVEGKMRPPNVTLRPGTQYGLPGDPSPAARADTMSLDEVITLHKELSTGIANAMRSGNKGRGVALMDLRNALRDDSMEIIGNNITPDQMQQYAGAIGNYHKLMNATRTLGNSLKDENLSASAFGKALFEGKTSHGRVTAVKAILEETSPGTWDNIVGNYWGTLRESAYDVTTRKTDWNKLDRTWGKLDYRVKKELAEGLGTKVDGVNALFNIGRRWQNTDFRQLTSAQQDELAGSLSKLLVGNSLARNALLVKRASELFSRLGKEYSMTDWLNDGGVETVVRRVNGINAKHRMGIVSSFRQWFDAGKGRQEARRLAVEGLMPAAVVSARRGTAIGLTDAATDRSNYVEREPRRGTGR